MSYGEPLKDVFIESGVIVLDFAEIPSGTPAEENVQVFFEEAETAGINPRAPESRQQFNDRVLAARGLKYLIGRYREDRSSMLVGSQIYDEGRTIHLGVDVFAAGLEPIYAPSEGEIVATGYEEQAKGYGHHLTFKPSDQEIFIFLGHLAKDLPLNGLVKKGEQIARLGDYVDDENGGWSRHLHLQMMRNLPPAGETPIGYSSKADFAQNSQKYPDPMKYFKNWRF